MRTPLLGPLIVSVHSGAACAVSGAIGPRDQNREGSGEGGDDPLADPVVVKAGRVFFSSGRGAELLGKVPWLPRTENL